MKKIFWEGLDMVSYMGFATPLQRDIIIVHNNMNNPLTCAFSVLYINVISR